MKNYTVLKGQLDELRLNASEKPNHLLKAFLLEYPESEAFNDLTLEVSYYKGCACLYDGNFETMAKIGETMVQTQAYDDPVISQIYGLNLMGMAAMNQSSFSEALYFYLKGLDLAQQEHKLRMVAVFLMNICYLLRQCKLYSQFDDYMAQCLQVCQSLGNPRMKLKAMLINAYCYLDQDQYVKGLLIMEHVRPLLKHSQNNIDHFYYHLLWNRIHLTMGNGQQCLSHLKKAEACIEDMGIQRLTLELHMDYVTYYLSENLLKEAQYHGVKVSMLVSGLTNDYYHAKVNLLLKAIRCATQNHHNLKQELSSKNMGKEGQAGKFRRFNDIYEAFETAVKVALNVWHPNEKLRILSDHLRAFIPVISMTLIDFEASKGRIQALYSHEDLCLNKRKRLKDSMMVRRLATVCDNVNTLDTFRDEVEVLRWYIAIGVQEHRYFILEVESDQEFEHLPDLDFVGQRIEYFLHVMARMHHKDRVHRDSVAILDEDFINMLRVQCGISNRELEIIKKVAEGSTNLVIGEQLKIAQNTVKNHLNRIYKKLCVNNRYELMSYLLEHRLPLNI